MKIKILTDNYFISNRLKEIDESYYVLYNSNSKKYELHSSAQFDNSYCLTFPYSALDKRAIDFALKSRVQNKKKIFEEIEKENEKFIKSKIKESKNLALDFAIRRSNER